MSTVPPGIIELYGIMAFVFVLIPAKILYNNAAGLRPIARFVFSLTSPGIFIFCMMYTFVWTSPLFDTSRNGYSAVTGALMGISVAALVVFLWYRLLQSIARKHSPIEERFFPDS
jgi:hypothetical protein